MVTELLGDGEIELEVSGNYSGGGSDIENGSEIYMTTLMNALKRSGIPC